MLMNSLKLILLQKIDNNELKLSTYTELLRKDLRSISNDHPLNSISTHFSTDTILKKGELTYFDMKILQESVVKQSVAFREPTQFYKAIQTKAF